MNFYVTDMPPFLQEIMIFFSINQIILMLVSYNLAVQYVKLLISLNNEQTYYNLGTDHNWHLKHYLFRFIIYHCNGNVKINVATIIISLYIVTRSIWYT